VDDLRGLNEVTNPLVGMSPSNVHKDDVFVSDANLGTNRAAPMSYVQLIWNVNAIMGDRGMLHAEPRVRVLRTRALGIEHDGTWVGRRCARNRKC
jgi:hypothetical protein